MICRPGSHQSLGAVAALPWLRLILSAFKRLLGVRVVRLGPMKLRYLSSLKSKSCRFNSKPHRDTGIQVEQLDITHAALSSSSWINYIRLNTVFLLLVPLSKRGRQFLEAVAGGNPTSLKPGNCQRSLTDRHAPLVNHTDGYRSSQYYF